MIEDLRNVHFNPDLLYMHILTCLSFPLSGFGFDLGMFKQRERVGSWRNKGVSFSSILAVFSLAFIGK